MSIPFLPSSRFRRAKVYVDSNSFGPRAIEAAVRLYGADRICAAPMEPDSAASGLTRLLQRQRRRGCAREDLTPQCRSDDAAAYKGRAVRNSRRLTARLKTRPSAFSPPRLSFGSALLFYSFLATETFSSTVMDNAFDHASIRPSNRPKPRIGSW